MIISVSGHFGYTAEDFKKIVDYLGIPADEIIFSPVFLKANDGKPFTKWVLIKIPEWKIVCSFSDTARILKIVNDTPFCLGGETVLIDRILGTPTEWDALKEL